MIVLRRLVCYLLPDHACDRNRLRRHPLREAVERLIIAEWPRLAGSYQEPLPMPMSGYAIESVEMEHLREDTDAYIEARKIQMKPRWG